MRIYNSSLLLSTFILILLAVGCSSDPKVETNSLPSVGDQEITNSIAEATPKPPTPSAEEIAAAKAEELAAEKAAAEALKAEKKKEKEEAASKERRRKRREKRKKRAAEKAAAEKLAREDATRAAATTAAVTAPDDAIARSVAVVQEEDLSDVDPELLKVVQVKQTGGTPRIRFDAETFDFGRIIQGKEIDHEFEFTNVGSAPLVINNVEVTCGCTTPFYPFIPIEPGERGKISVHFSSKGRLGNQTPTITVYTNTDPGTFELHLKGIIDTEREGQ